LQSREERLGRGRRLQHAFFEHFFGRNRFPIEPPVGFLVRLHHGAVQRNASKQPARSRIGQDLGRHRGVGCGSGGASLGAGRGRGITTDRELVRKQVVDTLAIHDQHDNIG
jgi:hypothetical protein